MGSNGKYGIPYRGSKSAFAADLIRIFPSATNFYDLFGGGFSVTHAMLLHRRHHFQHFHFNELQSDIVTLIKDSIFGKYSYLNFKPPFIDRQEFEQRLNEAYVRCFWSFGNNQKTYLFGKDIEDGNRSLHNAVVFNEFDDLAQRLLRRSRFTEPSITERRLMVGRYLKGPSGQPYQLEQLQQLERLQRLQQLERLQQLQQLEFSSVCYQDVMIKADSIIYADPPYSDTGSYGKQAFDSARFYAWARDLKHPVFFSEFSAPDDFKLIWSKRRGQGMSATARRREFFDNVYVNDTAYQLLNDLNLGR